MAWQTPKTNWAAGDGVANGDLNRIEENVRMLSQSAGAFGTCTGSANAYSVTASPPLTSLSEGSCVAVKINVTNTAGSTINVNGLGAKAIKKGNGLDVAAGQLKAGSIYTLRYDGVNFILQGEGGDYGNAQPEHVLAPYTIGTEDGVIPGTMPNNGPTSAETINLTAQNQEYTIASGWHSGLRKIKAVISNLAAGVIKADTTVGGILGTFTADATATAARILSGYTAYVNGQKVTGNIPSKAAQTYTPTTTDQAIGANQWLTGIQTIKGDANLQPANIKSGVSIFGKVGTVVPGYPIIAGDLVFRSINSPGEITGASPVLLPRWFIIQDPGTYTFKITYWTGNPEVPGECYLLKNSSNMTGTLEFPGYAGNQGTWGSFTIASFACNKGDIVKFYGHIKAPNASWELTINTFMCTGYLGNFTAPTIGS